MRIYPVKRPLCAIIFAFILGLWLSNTTNVTVFGCAFLCLVGIFIYCCRRLRQPLLFVVCVLTFAGGFLFMSHAATINQGLVPWHGDQVTIEATVVRAPRDGHFIDGRVVAVNGHTLEDAVNLRIKRAFGDEATYAERGTYRFEGQLTAPDIQTNPGGFDEETMLAQRGIFSTLRAKAPGQQTAAPPPWMQGLAHLTDRYTEILQQNLNPGEQALIIATLFGDVSDLSEDFYTLSQQFGIIHIFSVSGFHVTFILGFLLAIARLLHRQNSWGLLVLLVPLLTLYTLLSGASAPSIRASLMGILALLALRLLRYRDPLTIVALAAAMLLIANPYNLGQIGFQLSFLAMLGIILITPRLQALLTTLPNWLSSSIALSLGAELACLPLVAYYFYIFSPLSVLMNLIIVPWFSLLVPLALVAILITGCIPALGPLVFLPLRMIITVIVALMNIVHTCTGTMHVYIGQPSAGLLIAYYACLVLFILLPLGKRPPRLAALGAVSLCLLAVLLHPTTADNLRLTAVDVGQGSGALYHSAENDWLVFDTGPGKDTMAQTLRYYGVNDIEAIVISHSDSDHITGTAHILRDFDVRYVIAAAYAQKSEAWAALAPYLGDTKVITVEHPLHFKAAGGLQLDCALCGADQEGQANSNQVVSQLKEQKLTILFPGDADNEALTEIPWQQPVNVVLVPHHGSRSSYSDDFYRTYDPQLAIISAGRHNRHGHPHTEVTEGLASLSIPTLCTADTGAIMLYDTKQGLAIETFLPLTDQQ